jgi:hypothetical protein
MKPGTVGTEYVPPSFQVPTRLEVRLAYDGTGHAGLSFQALPRPRPPHWTSPDAKVLRHVSTYSTDGRCLSNFQTPHLSGSHLSWMVVAG